MYKLKIVFVYLNSSFPAYLIENIRRTHNLFPDLEIYLVGNIQLEPDDLPVTFIRVNTIQFEKDFDNHSLDRHFRSGFWQSSIMRLLILEEVHANFPDNPILHIESDVLLMSNFPINLFENSSKSAWNNFNESSDVGALVFSPNLSETSYLVSTLRTIIREDPRITDMTALFRARQLSPDRFLILPSSYTDANFSNFPFIFDGAILGMWLFGQDPRNHYGGQPRFRNLPESKYTVRRGGFFISSDGCLMLRERDKISPVVSLHIHCKDVRLFHLRNDLFRSRIIESSKYFVTPIFLPRVFISLLVQSIKHREFLGFAFNFPLFGRLFKLIRKALK